MQIEPDEAVADEAYFGKRVVRLRNDLLPVGLVRLVKVNGNHAAARGVDVGLEEEPRAVVAQECELVLKIVDKFEASRGLASSRGQRSAAGRRCRRRSKSPDSGRPR